MKHKKENIILGILLAMIVSKISYAQMLPDIRELESNNVEFKQQSNLYEDNIVETEDITKKLEQNLSELDKNETIYLKGGVSEIRAIVGKSQLIRFDEPVKRIVFTKEGLVEWIWLSPQELLLNGKSGGETSLIVWGESSKEPMFFTLFVENNSMNFIKEVEKVAPGQDIEISFANTGDEETLRVILTGNLTSTRIRERIKKLTDAYQYELVDLTEALAPQVMIELKVAEIKRLKDKTTNINPLFYLANSGANIRNDLNKLTYELKFDSGDFTGFIYDPGLDLQLDLKAAETEGLLKILAEPKLMTLDGKKAEFNSGLEIPIPAGLDELGNLIIEYKEVGTVVSFTPEILEDSGRIRLEIKPEVSELDPSSQTVANGFTVYGFATRSANTTVELADGQTMVIGGLIQTTMQSQKTKFPILSNLPVIGKFLNSSTMVKNETEVVIFVTPHIIKPDYTGNGV